MSSRTVAPILGVAIAVAVAAAIAACGSSTLSTNQSSVQPSSGSSSSSAAPSITPPAVASVSLPNACSLVATADVAAAYSYRSGWGTGTEVQDLVSPTHMGCQFSSSSDSVKVSVLDRTTYHDYDVDPGYQAVSATGAEAKWNATTNVFILLKSAVGISIQGPISPSVSFDQKSAAIALGGTILPRLPQ